MRTLIHALLLSGTTSLTLPIIVLAQSWTNQNTGISQVIFPIKAVDENTVWAGSENGVYLRTTDGGANWTSGTVPGAGPINFLSIAAIDSDTAYFAGASFSAIDTRIYKTTDGGASWEMQYRTTSPAAFINSIAFWDEAHGIAVSDPVDGSFVILTTANGGVNWNQIPSQNIPPPLTGEFAGFGDGGGTPLAVAGSSHAWFGTAFGIVSNDPIRVFKSTDQGQTWTVTNTELENEGQFHGISSITFKDTLNGFAGSGGFGTTGAGNTLARTTDGGETWSVVSAFVLTQSQVGTLIFVPNTGYQILLATTLGGPAYSKDGGTNWMAMGTDQFIGISFVSPVVGWAGGPNGRIAKFNGDLSTTVAGHHDLVPAEFSLLQNYPNPFNPSTIIRYEIPKPAQVMLAVYNLLGEKVRTLVDAKLSAGVRQATWDGRDEHGQRASSGVYLYRLEAGDFTMTKRLVLMK